MLDKLNVVFQRFNEVNDLIIQPDIISDSKRYVKLNREYKNLKPLVDAREEYLELTSRIEEAKTVLKEEKDPDFRDMAKLELDELEPAFLELEEAIKILLIPKDPEDDKNALVEIRQGAGGDEGAIFAGDLFRMYQRYCEGKGWKIEVISMNEGTAGGFKEVSFDQLFVGMRLAEDLKIDGGFLLASSGADVDRQLLKVIMNYNSCYEKSPFPEKIQVKVPKD